MYLEEFRSAADIASHFGCSATTILRHLRGSRIPIRSRGPCIERTETHVGQRKWSPESAYTVGLIATDGNWGRKKPVITIVSKDLDLLDTVRRCLHVKATIRTHRGGYSQHCHRLSWYDRSLYQWFREIGLTPAKTLTLRPLCIPDEYFVDFFRGCVDGDGSIVVYTDRYHVTKRDRYVYERLYLCVVSASCRFIHWLRATVHRLTNVNGTIDVRKRLGHHPLWKLRYAKTAAIRLLRWMYYAPGIPCLQRKRATAEKFLGPVGHATHRGVGRPRAGWIYNPVTRT